MVVLLLSGTPPGGGGCKWLRQNELRFNESANIRFHYVCRQIFANKWVLDIHEVTLANTAVRQPILPKFLELICNASPKAFSDERTGPGTRPHSCCSTYNYMERVKDSSVEKVVAG